MLARADRRLQVAVARVVADHHLRLAAVADPEHLPAQRGHGHTDASVLAVYRSRAARRSVRSTSPPNAVADSA
jgi:hypothetical protein